MNQITDMLLLTVWNGIRNEQFLPKEVFLFHAHISPRADFFSYSNLISFCVKTFAILMSIQSQDGLSACLFLYVCELIYW